MAERSKDIDDDVMTFVMEQLAVTANEFGRDPRDLPHPVVIEWGSVPEFRTSTGDGKPRLFIQWQGRDWWRIRYQAAHEVFHWVCTPGNTFHWVHEMFATHLAMQAMTRLGEIRYVELARSELANGARLLSRDDMLRTRLSVPYPAGLYGQAFETGAEMIAAVGWKKLKPLALAFDSEGRPDLRGWYDGLTSEEQSVIKHVIGDPVDLPVI